MRKKLAALSNGKQFSQFFQDISDCPEFRFAKGDFLKKLEYAFYFNMGGFRYPAHLVLYHAFQSILEDMEIPVVIQNIKFMIMRKPVYEIPCDLAIMGQDVNRVVGPVDDLMEDSDFEAGIEKTLEALKNFKPSKMGEILFSSPSWCKAAHLMEAIVYNFEAEDEMTSEKIVYCALKECLLKSHELKASKIAVEALGVYYNLLKPQSFIEILNKLLLEMAGNLPCLKEIVIASQNEEQTIALQKAFQGVFNINKTK